MSVAINILLIFYLIPSLQQRAQTHEAAQGLKRCSDCPWSCLIPLIVFLNVITLNWPWLHLVFWCSGLILLVKTIHADISALEMLKCDFSLLWAPFADMSSGLMPRLPVRWTAVSLTGRQKEEDLAQGTFSVSLITLQRNVCYGRSHQPHEQI